MVKSYKDLDVWKKSIELVKDVYILVKYLPKEEIYVLSDQLRRSAISVASNIAEGSARNGTKEFIKFLYIALGSLSELETQLIIAKEIGYISNFEKIENDILAIKKMIHSMISSLKRKSLELKHER